MTAEQFTYWFQGFLEIQNPESLDKKQIMIIQDHLDLVFNKVTPNRHLEEKKNELDGIKIRKTTSGPKQGFGQRRCGPTVYC